MKLIIKIIMDTHHHTTRDLKCLPETLTTLLSRTTIPKASTLFTTAKYNTAHTPPPIPDPKMTELAKQRIRERNKKDEEKKLRIEMEALKEKKAWGGGIQQEPH